VDSLGLPHFHNHGRGRTQMATSLGVVQTQGVEIIGFEEKPIARSHINACVYVLDPATLSVLTAAAYCDMLILFERLQVKTQRTAAYPMHEPWLDVGRRVNLQLANNQGAYKIESDSQ
jgi:NDP-sugar pyrophosphorylase family protein